MEKENVKSKMKNAKISLLFFSFLLAFFTLGLSIANAASLNFSPTSGTYQVGQVFPVEIRTSSADQSMNATEGVITFPQDKLEVVSLSKSNSIINLWVQEPSFSNAEGTMNFEGIVLNPGYKGAGGRIITVNFRGKAVGSAPLAFSSASVLANDGLGTNILETIGTAQFNLAAAGIAPPEAISGIPAAPQISSPTHPDPNKWYAKEDSKFTWQIPSGITGARALLDRNADSTPYVAYGPTVSEKEFEDLADGIWYFHFQLRNASGWGEISHFRFQIDTTKPDFLKITEVPRPDLTDPKAKFILEAEDSTSGIDHYEIQADGGESKVWLDDGTHTYPTPVVQSGKHILIVKAVDKAGNFLTESAEFIVEPLLPPEITEYPRELTAGEILTIEGVTYPNVKVTLWVQREEGEVRAQVGKSDNQGNFSFLDSEKLKEGIYKAWAEVEDDRGAKSGPSEKVSILVRQSTFWKIGSFMIAVLSIIIPLIALLIVLIVLLFYTWRKISRLKRKIKKEVREAESSLHTAFDLLKEDIQKHIELLEKIKSKRELTQEEKKIITQLKKDLDAAEKLIRKEIEDIERVN